MKHKKSVKNSRQRPSKHKNNYLYLGLFVVLVVAAVILTLFANKGKFTGEAIKAVAVNPSVLNTTQALSNPLANFKIEEVSGVNVGMNISGEEYCIRTGHKGCSFLVGETMTTYYASTNETCTGPIQDISTDVFILDCKTTIQEWVNKYSYGETWVDKCLKHDSKKSMEEPYFGDFGSHAFARYVFCYN